MPGQLLAGAGNAVQLLGQVDGIVRLDLVHEREPVVQHPLADGV